MIVDVSGKIIAMGFHPMFWGGFPPAEVCDVYLRVEKQFCRAESCKRELPQGSWGCEQCT